MYGVLFFLVSSRKTLFSKGEFYSIISQFEKRKVIVMLEEKEQIEVRNVKYHWGEIICDVLPL